MIILFPLFVNAKLNELKLDDQFNIGYKNLTYNNGYFITTNIDSLTTTYDNYNGTIKYNLYNDNFEKQTSFNLKENQNVLYGKDFYIIEETINNKHVYYTYNFNNKKQGTYNANQGTIIVSPDGNNAYFYNMNSTTITKINPKTLKEIKKVPVPTKIESVIFSNNKIYIINSNNYYEYDLELLDFKKIKKSEFKQDELYNLPSANIVSDSKYQELVKYLEEKENISKDSLITNYAIEYKNQYYTIVSNEGNILSLIYTDKDFTELGIINLKNKDINIQYGFENAKIYATEKGISVLAKTYNTCEAAVEQIGCSQNIIYQEYSLTYDIKNQTDGNGTIKVLGASKAGEPVTFNITPEEGYVLGVVKVTDKDGNVLTFTDYKFTMPSSDVTIEATFLPENPETSDLITYIILLFGLTTLFIIYIKNEQKRKYYKNIK